MNKLIAGFNLAIEESHNACTATNTCETVFGGQIKPGNF